MTKGATQADSQSQPAAAGQTDPDPALAPVAATSVTPATALPPPPSSSSSTALQQAGAALSVARSVVDAGSTLAAKAGAALADAQAAANFQGKDGSTGASGAKALLDSIGALSGHDDMKKVLGASWVLLSESAKVFTIGRVAVSLLEQMYSMWNCWSARTVWAGEFIAFLQLVEEDLCAGQAVFQHLGALRELERTLASARDQLGVITSRGRYASFLFALSDEQALLELKVRIDARKQECLFGHLVDVKIRSAQNVEGMNRIAELVHERQQRMGGGFKALGADGMTLEQRGEKMKRLAHEFGVMDMGPRVRAHMDSFARAQRGHLVRKWADAGAEGAEKVKRYVAAHLISFVLSPALDLLEAGSEQPLEEADAAREAERFAALDQANQAAQVEQLRNDLEEAVRGAKEGMAKAAAAAEAQVASPLFADTLTRIKQGRSLLASLRACSPTDADFCTRHSDTLSSTLRSVRDAQLDAYLLLPSSDPTASQLLAFRPVSASERPVYQAMFQRAFADELAHARAWMSTDAAEQRKFGIGARERLLAIRAPAPITVETEAAAVATVPASPSSLLVPSADPSDAACVTSSIFLSFLSELAPLSLRALHFVPPRAEQERDRALRAARKAAREAARTDARRAAHARSKVAWKERNAHKAAERAAGRGDDVSDDEEPMDDPDADAMAEEFALAPESAAETAAEEAKLGLDDSFASANLRRAFPSLSFQLSQSLSVYYANLLSKGAMLTRSGLFSKLNSSDFVDQIIVAPIMQAGKAQDNPNEPSAEEKAKGVVAEKVCLALDGACWSFSHPPGESDALSSGGPLPNTLDEALRHALGKQVPRFPPWLGLLLTIPHVTVTFDKRVLADPSHGGKALALQRHALGDLSEFAEGIVLPEEAAGTGAVAEAAAAEPAAA